MWRHALGLNAVIDDKVRAIQDLNYKKEAGWEIKSNSGIRMPDIGNCDQVEQREKCELPDYSKFYTWSQRAQDIREPLGLVQLLTAFRFYGIGTGMSVVVFVMEKAMRKINETRASRGITRGGPAKVYAWQ